MNTLMTPLSEKDQPSSCSSKKSGLRKYGLWIVLAVIASTATAAAFFGLTWQAVGKYLPFALILACPAMHLLMCRNHKTDSQAPSDSGKA